MNGKEFVAAVERFHFRYNTLPTREQFNAEFSTEFNEERWERWTTNAKFVEHLAHKGLRSSKYATPEMITIADCVLDTSINSLPLKLKNAGLSIADYNKVKNNRLYIEVLRERTDRLPEYARSEVIASLAKRAAEGNVAAQRLYLEVTGEYTPHASLQVTNVSGLREVVLKLMEVLQRHVSNNVYIQIVHDFEQVMTNQSADQITVEKALPKAVEENIYDIVDV